MATISYKSRIKAIVEAIAPVATKYGFTAEMADQRNSEIQNSSGPQLFVGIQSHTKLSFQDYLTVWNEENQNYDTSGTYVALNRIFIDYYTNTYDFIDISQEIQIVLNNTIFTGFNMTCSFFETILNNTNTSFVQGRLRQSAKTICGFMMTDEITLPPVYKADRITVNGTINDDTSFSIEVDLDG